jgi:glycosyltransferase involved in cell wall biosynthesis
MRLLCFVREPFPTFRVDLSVLFGQELLGRGHHIDFVMQAASERQKTGRQPWNTATVWVGKTNDGEGVVYRLVDQVLSLLHDLRCLWLVSPARYDAVQVKDKVFLAPLIYFVARLRGLKFFYWLSFPMPDAQLLRADDPSTSFRPLIRLRARCAKWLLYRWLMPRADHVFVQSEQMKQDVLAYAIPADRVTPVPMGVPKEELQDLGDDARSHESAPGSALDVVYLGTIARARRLEVLVDTLTELRRMGTDARLTVIGDGDGPRDREFLERYAAAAGVSDIFSITGFLPRSQALERVRHADIGLSPFFPVPILLSTSPTKLVEYMALGVPVVANEHPEQRRVLHASRAGVCVPWGGRYFAKGIRFLAETGRERRREMGLRGRRWVREHRAYDVIAGELEQKYCELLGVELHQSNR